MNNITGTRVTRTNAIYMCGRFTKLLDRCQIWMRAISCVLCVISVIMRATVALTHSHIDHPLANIPDSARKLHKSIDRQPVPGLSTPRWLQDALYTMYRVIRSQKGRIGKLAVSIRLTKQMANLSDKRNEPDLLFIVTRDFPSVVIAEHVSLV